MFTPPPLFFTPVLRSLPDDIIATLIRASAMRHTLPRVLCRAKNQQRSIR